ncbi:hypothetical protein TeGR_g617, partial [Tetraparma gracilis]
TAMTKFGSALRSSLSVVLTITCSLLCYWLSTQADPSRPIPMPITISSLFPFYSWIQLQLLKDDPILASASKGFNFGQLTVAPLTYVFYHSYSAVDAIQRDAANMTEVLASLP